MSDSETRRQPMSLLDWWSAGDAATGVPSTLLPNATRAAQAGSTAVSAGRALNVGMNGASTLLGGISVYNGIQGIREGDTSQGVLDIVSGGAGMLSGGASLATALSPAAAGLATGGVGALGKGLALAGGPVGAAIAGGLALGALGNKEAERNSWYDWPGNLFRGEDDRTEQSSFLGSIGNSASGAYGATSDFFGGGILGTGAGILAGGLAGAGQTVWNTGAAITAGIGRVGGAILSFLSDDRLKGEVAPIRSPLALIDAL
jgi:hypothetical protein